MNVARLRNAEALDAEPLQDLLREAMPEGTLVLPAGFDQHVDEFKAMVADSDLNEVIVGTEKGEFRAMGWIAYPAGSLMDRPQVVHFYNKGTAKLRNAVIEEGVQAMVERGYAQFHAINATGKDDEAWKKAFSKAGEAEHVGSIFNFRM